MTHTMKHIATCSVMALAAAAATTDAQAQMVVNGGFETGDFSGWTESGAIGSVYGVDTAGPRNGSYSAYFGASTPAAWIAQTVATTAGQSYFVSFFFDRSAATGSGSFVASLGGVPFFADPGFTFPFAQITVQVTASSSNALLRFSASNAADFYTLDSISVSAVPEPGAAALWLVGLAGVAALALRRRR